MEKNKNNQHLGFVVVAWRLWICGLMPLKFNRVSSMSMCFLRFIGKFLFTERGAMGEKERQFLVGLNWLDEKTLKQSDGVRDGLLGSKLRLTPSRA